jgi:hypothetical protein
MTIQVRDFAFKSDPGRRVQGFVAQELDRVYPEAVTTNGDDGLRALDSHAAPWAVDYGRLTPLIVRSVQQVQEEVDALRAQVDQLRSGR